MGKNRDYLLADVVTATLKACISDDEYQATRREEDENWLATTSGNEMRKIGDRQEAELQALDDEIDMDDLDDMENFSTEKAIERMNKEQEINTKYEHEMNQVMDKTEREQKQIGREKEVIQVRLEDNRAQLDTWQELKDSADCSYFGE